jgi:hypothetical protein
MATRSDLPCCLPCTNTTHHKVLHVTCDEPGCGASASFCWFSFQGPIQTYQCPAHQARRNGLIYSYDKMDGLVPAPAVFHPSPSRWCSCCRQAVRFTVYCPACGYPEDLCARRVDELRTSLFHGHNEYTHCPRCPRVAPMIIVPAALLGARSHRACKTALRNPRCP